MAFIPNRTNFINFQNTNINHRSSRNLELQFGTYGLNINQSCLVTSYYLEMVNNLLANETKKSGRYWIRVFPQVSSTVKPMETRMGNGKGYVHSWIANLKQGVVFCEVSEVSLIQARLILNNVALNTTGAVTFISK